MEDQFQPQTPILWAYEKGHDQVAKFFFFKIFFTDSEHAETLRPEGARLGCVLRVQVDKKSMIF